MPARTVDPRRLDVAAFAADGATLEGRFPIRTLERLCETVDPEAPPVEGDVTWRVQGELVPVAGGPSQTWLRLDASAQVALTCQRCLAPVRVPLDVHRRILFVAGEDAAAQLDAEREEDVLALSRALDLRELVEDELLLAEPLVPVHDVCPEPLPLHDADLDGEAEEHPFAALASLKRRPPPS
ncbi:MAG TPA: YceD family protein [Caldimonas sp.]|nr:YceD family protein [Caldimonas sp.]